MRTERRSFDSVCSVVSAFSALKLVYCSRKTFAGSTCSVLLRNAVRGFLHGTTASGGTSGNGVVFEIIP